VEAVLRRLNGIAGDLAEQRDLGAIIEAMSDEERDQLRDGVEAVAKLREALDADEMSVEVADQRN
jgi:hypothetical protein